MILLNPTLSEVKEMMAVQITPKINEGDVINIAYKPKGEFNGTSTIKSVKIQST